MHACDAADAGAGILTYSCHEHASQTDMKEKKFLKSLLGITFSLHTKKYFCSFITLRLKHCCHMDYFNDVLTAFLGLEHGNCAAVFAESESSRIS